jgi:hypothetical protein
MKSAAECFEQAALCEEQAERSTDEANKWVLLAAARHWRAQGEAAKRAELKAPAGDPPAPKSNLDTTPVDVSALQCAVEGRHGGKAALAYASRVREVFEDKLVWDGVVYVFDLAGHPKATRAYAWSSPIEGSDKRLYVQLHLGGIRSPLEAVRAVIVAERKAAK